MAKSSSPTFGNWSEGEYRYIHVASEQDNTQAFETSDGTIKVKQSTDDGGDGGDDGGLGTLILAFLALVGVTIGAVVGYLHYIDELETVINDVQQRFP